jgi:Tol biopolymer transport system component
MGSQVANIMGLIPAWSPDGGRIVVASLVPDSHGLYVAKADGTGLNRVYDEVSDPHVSLGPRSLR